MMTFKNPSKSNVSVKCKSNQDEDPRGGCRCRTREYNREADAGVRSMRRWRRETRGVRRETGNGSTMRGQENSREAGKWEKGVGKLEVE